MLIDDCDIYAFACNAFCVQCTNAKPGIHTQPQEFFRSLSILAGPPFRIICEPEGLYHFLTQGLMDR
jgi:hypothetical protein